jgi:hypothetical protein
MCMMLNVQYEDSVRSQSCSCIADSLDNVLTSPKPEKVCLYEMGP